MRTTAILGFLGIVGVGLITPVPARGHHAFAAEFDANRPFKIVGTVVRVDWTNPHVWIHFDVKDADGKIKRWMIEGGAPGALARRGFTRGALPIGTELVVEGYLAKAEGDPQRANGRAITYKDGRILFFGSSGSGAPVDGRDSGEKK